MASSFRFQMGFTFFGAVALLLPIISASSQTELRDNRSARFSSPARDRAAIADLPSHVPVPAASLSLFADFDHPDDIGIPLYLINATDKEISFGASDADLSIKLEHRNEKGDWTRAQAHASSTCGLSYYPILLPAHQFFKLHGYMPPDGTPANVRYARAWGSTLISNAGPGRVSAQDLEAVQLDDATLHMLPRFITDAIRTAHLEPNDAARLEPLGERTEGVRALTLLPYNAAAMNGLERLKELTALLPKSPDRSSLLAAIETVRQFDWSRVPTRKALFSLCIDSIRNPATAPEILSPTVAWNLLAHFTYPDSVTPDFPDQLDASHWREVVELALAFPDESPYSRAVQNIFETDWLADTHIPSGVFAQALTTKSPINASTALQALLRRQQINTLVEVGPLVSPEWQLRIFGSLVQARTGTYLAQRQLPWPDPGSPEWKFWEYCAEMNPINALDATGWWPGQPIDSSVKECLRQPLTAFWEGASPTDTFDHKALNSLQFLATDDHPGLSAFGGPSDINIFEQLLSHPYSQEDSVSDRDEQTGLMMKIRRYPIRRIALQALIERGCTIPADVVILEHYPSPDQ